MQVEGVFWQQVKRRGKNTLEPEEIASWLHKQMEVLGARSEVPAQLAGVGVLLPQPTALEMQRILRGMSLTIVLGASSGCLVSEMGRCGDSCGLGSMLKGVVHLSVQISTWTGMENCLLMNSTICTAVCDC